MQKYGATAEVPASFEEVVAATADEPPKWELCSYRIRAEKVTVVLRPWSALSGYYELPL
jgi:hypothetical protein